jgi:tektin-1
MYFRSVTEDQWQDYSNKNILDTEKQRQNSENLRSLMDGILQAVANDMNRQKENTDLALAKRIAETRDAKEKLEAHVAKVRCYRFVNIIFALLEVQIQLYF